MANALAFPNRVSRLYPVFALIFLLTSGVFLYAWQDTRIQLQDLPNALQRNTELTAQITSLTKTNTTDEATLKVQKQQISDAATQLSALQQQLTDKTKQISDLDSQISNQQTQLSANATELQKLRSQPPLFSFQNQSSLQDISQKEADVKQLVTDAYGYIQNVYGTPYLLSKVTITFVNSFSISGSAGEIVISNGPSGISMDIHLKDFDKNSFQDINTVVHEMIHAFHGVAVFETSAFEEGITVAAADAVMQNMIRDGKIPSFSHLYLTTDAATYDQWNASIAIPSDSTAFYSSPQISQIYQMIGTAWFRMYQADPDFFKKVNAYYYPLVQKGQSPDAAMALDAIRSAESSVNGTPISTYLANNRAFNPS